MAMDISVTTMDRKAVIRLGGRFDFSAHRVFRDAIDKALGHAGVAEVTVDLSDVAYLDSSALGMLLMLREKAKASSCTANLAGATGSVRQVLDVASFGKLFAIA